PEALSALAIPLDAPSLVRDVLAARTPYRGPLPKGAREDPLGLALRGPDVEVVLYPVSIRDRVAALLLAEGAREPIPAGLLERRANEAGGAYERLLRRAPQD